MPLVNPREWGWVNTKKGRKLLERLRPFLITFCI